MANRLAEKVAGPKRLEDGWVKSTPTLHRSRSKPSGYIIHCSCGSDAFYEELEAVICGHCDTRYTVAELNEILNKQHQTTT